MWVLFREQGEGKGTCVDGFERCVKGAPCG